MTKAQIEQIVGPGTEGDAERCPACEKGIKAEDLQRDLKKWQQEMKGVLGPVEEQIRKLEKEQRDLKKVIPEFELRQKDAEIKGKEVHQATKAIAGVLEKAISDAEDPLALVTQKIERIDEDLKEIHTTVVWKVCRYEPGMDMK